MTSILLWIYLFGWKSLITFPLWIVGFLLIGRMIKNWKAVLSGMLILGIIPSAIFLLFNYASGKTGVNIYYIFPILYIAYIYLILKMPDSED